MAWVIFKPDDRVVEEAVKDEAEAIARVAVLGGTTTSIEVDDGKGGSTLPDWFYPGIYVDADGKLEEGPIETDEEVSQRVAVLYRERMHEAYLWWRINGRTQHWAGLRTGEQKTYPLDATDKWAYHMLALMDRIIAREYLATLSGTAVLAAVDHIDTVFRTLGPTWYHTQIAANGNITANGGLYRTMSLDAGSPIYNDALTTAGIPRAIDGVWTAFPVVIAATFNPEAPQLGR